MRGQMRCYGKGVISMQVRKRGQSIGWDRGVPQYEHCKCTESCLTIQLLRRAGRPASSADPTVLPSNTQTSSLC